MPLDLGGGFETASLVKERCRDRLRKVLFLEKKKSAALGLLCGRLGSRNQEAL